MNVLYLTPGIFDKGGISRYNRYQIQALRDLVGSDRVVALSLLGPSGSSSDLETSFAVNWHGAGGGVEKGKFARAAVRFAHNQKPDMIWSGHLNYSALVWGLANLIRATAVVQVYGMEVWTPRPLRPDIWWGFRRVHHVVSDCHFTAQYVQEHLRPGLGVEVMWDCLDTERFTPGPPAVETLMRYGIPDPKSGFNILSLGRLSADAAYKGYERLLEVFARLPSHSHLIYAGGGDLIPRLQARAEELGVVKRVTFTGFVREEDLPDVYRVASAFCLIGDRGPGRGEGIPLTPLEAAACGVPILVGNQDGSREAVEQGVNGFALDPFDLDAIAHSLQRLIGDESYRQQLGQAARVRVVREHAYPIFRERMRRFLGKVGPHTSSGG